MLYKKLILPILFKKDAEEVHYLAIKALKWACKLPFGSSVLKLLYSSHPSREIEVAGIKFKNRIGLAAGFDKNGLWVDQLSTLGFGHIEVGTVTPRAQLGNDQPRLFRLPADAAILNRMGFNNDGVDKMVAALKKRKTDTIVGGNIGKNKLTNNDEAALDYLICFKKLFDVVDYFTVNVSSPNTAGLRELQDKEPLMFLLKELQAENKKHKTPKPIFLKIAPDLTNSQLEDIVDIVISTKLAGIVATNTTVSRAGLNTPDAEVKALGMGGISGKPLKNRSTEVIKYLGLHPKRNYALIAVGGIYTAADAQEKLDAGADLIQVYSGFIYEGPAIVKNILNNLRHPF